MDAIFAKARGFGLGLHFDLVLLNVVELLAMREHKAIAQRELFCNNAATRMVRGEKLDGKIEPSAGHNSRTALRYLPADAAEPGA
jgi:hypothetical protein